MITVTDIIFCILMLVLVGVMAYGCVRCGDERRENNYTMSNKDYRKALDEENTEWAMGHNVKHTMDDNNN